MRKLENMLWAIVHKMYLSRIPKPITDKAYDTFVKPLRIYNQRFEQWHLMNSLKAKWNA